MQIISSDSVCCVRQRMLNYQGWLLSISSSVVPFNKTTASPSTRLPVQTEARRWSGRWEKERERRRWWCEVLTLLGRYVGGHEARPSGRLMSVWKCLHWVWVLLCQTAGRKEWSQKLTMKVKVHRSLSHVEQHGCWVWGDTSLVDVDICLLYSKLYTESVARSLSVSYRSHLSPVQRRHIFLIVCGST